ncbi:MAG: FkbM family methyltransferase [Parvibaculaceae bacterium]
MSFEVGSSETGPVLTFRQRLTWTAHLFKAIAYQYHKELSGRLRPLVPQDALVIDVGAHSGQHTKIFARLVPQGHVYAFEPGVYARSILCKAIGMRGFRNVTVVPFGLSDKATTEVLNVPLKRSGSMGFGLSHIGKADEGRPGVTEEIKITTLDNFVAEQKLGRVDFVKVDIEGWEFNFLKGAVETIKKHRPILQLEITPPTLERANATPDDIFNLIMPLDYVAFETREQIDYQMLPVTRFNTSSDYLFVPREKRHLVKSV